MTKKSIANSNQSDFSAIIRDYNNDELINVLKKRKQYQKEAEEIAIQEAIKRGLIYSEQDLFADEFKEEVHTFSIFPIIENERNRKKIRISMTRLLLIAGALPVVWGAIRIFDNQILEGALLVVLGSIWIFAAIRLLKEFNSQSIYLMIVMLAVSAIYITKLFIAMKGIVLMDYLIPVVLYSFVLYGMLFIRKLN